ncbi:unnamed protein product, partial [Allacma fusca]
ESLGPSQYV